MNSQNKFSVPISFRGNLYSNYILKNDISFYYQPGSRNLSGFNFSGSAQYSGLR